MNRAASTAAAGEGLGDHEVYWDPVGAHPGTGLSRDGVEEEAGPFHCGIDQRVLAQRPDINGEVAVFRGFGDGDWCGAGVQIDGLRADHDNRVTVIGER